MSKNVMSKIQTHIKATGEPTFLNTVAKRAFNKLRQAFTKASILQYFDLECHIRIETVALGYVIRKVLSQLTSDHLTFDHNIEPNLTKSDLSKWQLVTCFFRKIILTKTWYETHNDEL